ncbi:MAG: alpha-xylosidase, partial [Clostridia bacterium]|nr:alpha-xylosidase [Clostridia bacterium]
VMSFVDGMAERKIPLQVFHFDCYWMRENEWCGFHWDERMFPDIEGTLARMKNEKHLKICVWINPYIGQKSDAFKEAMVGGYLLKKPDGGVWQTDLWQAGMGIVDFTNPAAWKWYQDKLRVLLHQGVDCFKTDFGERIPAKNVVWYDGSDPMEMHNYYSYLYNKCVYELLVEERGEGEAILFARSACPGGQKFPVHWGGDCCSAYPSMAESLRGGLSLCLSGFGFWSHDISGFEGTATADLYKRWAAFGLLSTHSRLHGSASYRVPWLFSAPGEEHGEESVAVLRYFANLKCTLMPYLYSMAVRAHKTGAPVMRAMVYSFPGDISCEDLDRQYMLGDSLLVAPVFSEDGSVDYYLPSGTWTHLLSGETREGGSWQRDTYDYFSLPLYAKENSIIAVGSDSEHAEYDYGRDLTLHVFALKTHAETSVSDCKGNEILSVTADQNDGVLTFCWKGNHISGMKLLLRGIGTIRAVCGAILADTTPMGVLLAVPDADAGMITVTL